MRYQVQHGATSTGPWVTMPEQTTRVLTVVGLTNGSPRFFRVRAISDVTDLAGDWTPTISRTPVAAPTPPAAPANFDGVPGDTIVALSWDAVPE